MTFARFCALVTLSSCLLAPAWSADLIEVYELALRSDPLLNEADANRLAAAESRPQARAALLPQLSFSATETDQSQDGLTSQFGQAQFVDTLVDGETDESVYSLSLSQSLFRWDQWLSLKQADKVVAQADVDYEAVSQGLLLRVAERYFDVLAARDTLESTNANKTAIARQLEQAETRFEVGLTAITDVQEARAAYDQSVASEIQARRLLATARENLRELTGTYVEGLENPNETLPLIGPNPASDDAWVELAIQQNLNLASSRLAVEIAKDSIKVQRAGHLPTLDLIVSRNERDSKTAQDLIYLPNPDPVPSPRRDDFSTNVVQLQFNLPIYGGGRVSSQVRESVFLHRAARERFERVARETERATRDAYLGVSSDISTVKALEQALASTETGLKATEAGFDVGTRTTVDVLDARRDLYSARTNLERSRYDYIINFLRLKLAAGTLTRRDLEEVNGWLH